MLSFVRLIVWGILWIPVWAMTTILRKVRGRPRLDNCLTWALRRWEDDGGYLVIRWARSSSVHWLRWPHFMWLSEDDHHKIRHLVPRDEEEYNAMRVLPDLWFEGRVQTGDDDDVIEN